MRSKEIAGGVIGLTVIMALVALNLKPLLNSWAGADTGTMPFLFMTIWILLPLVAVASIFYYAATRGLW